jgi:hypothetical protein
MNPRLLVVCLGGLAGGGAMVCCDLDAGTEAEFTPDGEAVDDPVLDLQADAAEAVH